MRKGRCREPRICLHRRIDHQTFHVSCVFAETFTAIVREHVTRLGRNTMRDDIRLLKTVKYAATAGAVLLVAGILTLMVLARGKTGDDGDIAGVVAPALLLASVSGVVAVVAAMRQKRAQRGVGRP